MPTYYTPPPTPPSTRFPARSDTFSHSTPVRRTLSTGNRGTSASTRTSTNSPSTSRSTATTGSHRLSQRLGLTSEDEAAVKKKTPYIFLGSIAAASLLAHKYWPKGFPHGDKEDWELSKWALRAKHKRAEAKREKEAARRGDRRRSGDGFGDEGYYYDERDLPRGRGDVWHERGRAAGYHGERVEVDEYAYGYTDTGRDWDPVPSRRGSAVSRRGRSRSRDRGCQLEPSYRRATSRERTELVTTTERYYPPAPKRYLLERSDLLTGSSSAASSGSRYFAERRTSTAGLGASALPQSLSYREDWPGEVVYLRLDPLGRARRASFDAGSVGRYERGYEWDYR
ncbi:hypothetical protein C8A05DRAFT_41591 [Staphylotrichum tortipilum]|uniref:Uncharacterized protein n=1 Tax=Staphylotrichum tortipilum TaxID=2831512 RepID=A0AAN6MTN2_9PEZI|nr:hypothetical protein C8A05DRAFT_41591 [Staphylotrichum longicolle]